MGQNPLTLDDYRQKPVSELKNVGPKFTEAFSKVGIYDLAELLRYYPRRYLDRRKQSTLNGLLYLEGKAEEESTVLCEVVGVAEPFKVKNRKLTIVKVDLADHEGTQFEAVFFNQPWRSKQLYTGMHLAVFGKLAYVKGKLQMTHPVVDLVGDQTGRIVPLYRLPKMDKPNSTYLPPNIIFKAIKETLSRSEYRGIHDPLPDSVRAQQGLISRSEALTYIHMPETFAQIEMARKRMAFDELLCMQLVLIAKRKEMENLKGLSHTPKSDAYQLEAQFLKKLPYSLTSAQERVIKEIQADLISSVPMHRMLQGDVGSGKTIVALNAILNVIEAGHQAAFLVPTEVLAEQHYEVVREFLSGISIPDENRLGAERELEVHLLSNRIMGKERKDVLDDLATGRTNLVVGTSALIYEGVEFKSLGLVVIDEQHRFGVNQRAVLREKSGSMAVPDSLAMTATPIPRTVAMTIYGDLEMSFLDEIPAGRLPVKTELIIGQQAREKMWEHVREQVKAGRQVYVVCPLIGEKIAEDGEVLIEDDEEGAQSATLKLDPSISVKEVYKELSTYQLKDLQIGFLHGRMNFEEKNRVMEDFRNARIDVLVSTTVIEVGVDVPNASVMVIFGAYRFGIAQLHQLRGRVGRSHLQSYCYLISDFSTERLEAVVETTDGFQLAEKDLELRREGTIMGNRQTGSSDLRAASLIKDRDLVPLARDAAEDLLKDGSIESAHPEWNSEVEFLLGQQEKTEYLLKS